MKNIKSQRRTFLKRLGLSAASIAISQSTIGKTLLKFNKGPQTFIFKDTLDKVNDRVWIGEDFWAIPMEEWSVKNKRVEFNGTQKQASVNVLTATIAEGKGDFLLQADMGLIVPVNATKKGSAGFSLGIRDDVDSSAKSACYFGKGLTVGVNLAGSFFIGTTSVSLPDGFDFGVFNLSVSGNQESITAVCKDRSGKTAEVNYKLTADISGLVAFVNNISAAGGEPFWFKSLRLSGLKVQHKPSDSFGPILWSMYTLSKGTVRVSVQMPPIGLADNQEVELYLNRGLWKKVASRKIDPDSYTVHFELPNWDAKTDVPFRCVYRNAGNDHFYEGMIRKEPAGELKFGGLTCQQGQGFPYTPLVKNLQKHNPDILFFSGDQIYEENGGYPIKRQPEPDAILSYLGKWYMFGWAFGNIMRDRPTICTPDDHDAFQGNLWGEGGKPVSMELWKSVASAHGGYVQTPRWVNAVSKTQCGHLPPSFHHEPLHSGIQTWYTDLLYGQVSFAIISDRMFKSGPEIIRPTEKGRIDFIPIENTHNWDDPNLEFLGSRQMQFLEHWTNDWKGAKMKVLLSQTLFASVGTHHGTEREVRGDLDSGGWPTQKKNDAIRLIRKASAFHINGDQHLPFIVQYNLDGVRDAGWAFCTPAISVGYPRWAQPDRLGIPHTDRPAHNLPDTGNYTDTFGTRTYIYAVGNPVDVATSRNRYLKAQEKASGFGLITFNSLDRSIKIDAFRFLADKDKPSAEDSFPGWPLTINQFENDGRKPTAFLPQLQINKADQVVKIVNDTTKEVVSVFRIKGKAHKPVIFDLAATYSVYVGEEGNVKEFKGISPSSKISKDIYVNL